MSVLSDKQCLTRGSKGSPRVVRPSSSSLSLSRCDRTSLRFVALRTRIPHTFGHFSSWGVLVLFCEAAENWRTNHLCFYSFFFPSHDIMAACAATSRVTTGIPSLSVSNKVVARGAAAVQASFAGLRSGNTRVDGLSLSRSRSFANRTAVAKSVANTTCGLDTPVVISLSTGALLFLGRFVFLPFQRDNVSGFSLAFWLSRNS